MILLHYEALISVCLMSMSKNSLESVANKRKKNYENALELIKEWQSKQIFFNKRLDIAPKLPHQKTKIFTKLCQKKLFQVN